MFKALLLVDHYWIHRMVFQFVIQLFLFDHDVCGMTDVANYFAMWKIAYYSCFPSSCLCLWLQCWFSLGPSVPVEGWLLISQSVCLPLLLCSSWSTNAFLFLRAFNSFPLVYASVYSGALSLLLLSESAPFCESTFLFVFYTEARVVSFASLRIIVFVDMSVVGQPFEEGRSFFTATALVDFWWFCLKAVRLLSHRFRWASLDTVQRYCL